MDYFTLLKYDFYHTRLPYFKKHNHYEEYFTQKHSKYPIPYF